MDRARFEELKHCGDLPSPSSAGMRILVLTRNEEYSIEEVITVIQSDPALTGRLIKLATSAQHAGKVKITSAREAAVRLGTRAVCSVAMGFSLISGNRKGRCEGFDYDGFWSSSLANAVSAQTISEELGIGEPVDAFTLALLSKVGQLALANVHPEKYAKVLERMRRDPSLSLVDLEGEHFYINHREVGAALLADWGLPDSFSETLLYFDGRDWGDDLPSEEIKNNLKVLNGASHMARVCLTDPERQASLWPGLKGIAKGLGARSSVIKNIFDLVVPQWKDWARILRLPTNEVASAEDLEQQARRLASTTELPEAEQPVVKKLRILAVDDDPVSLRLLVALLERDGHHVMTARNGREALAVYVEHGAQMVVTDWMMPEMDGLQLCTQIRKTREGRKLYILLLTGQSEEQRIVEAFGCGVDDYIVKPFKAELLKARIQPALRVINLQEDNDQQVREKELLNRQLDIEKRRFKLAAMTDTLTELPNRRAAMSRLERQWSDSERTGRSFSVIMLDVDHFKRINDGWGHDVGDAVLRSTARVIYEELRKGDTCARMGGEEFLVICPTTETEHDAKMVAERIRKAVEANRVRLGSFEGSVTISLGIGVRNTSTRSIDALLKTADEAVYAAKRSGRNRTALGKPSGDGRQSA